MTHDYKEKELNRNSKSVESADGGDATSNLHEVLKPKGIEIYSTSQATSDNVAGSPLLQMKAAASEEKAGGKQSIPELSIGGLPAMEWPEEKNLDISWEDLELVRDYDRGY